MKEIREGVPRQSCRFGEGTARARDSGFCSSPDVTLFGPLGGGGGARLPLFVSGASSRAGSRLNAGRFFSTASSHENDWMELFFFRVNTSLNSPLRPLLSPPLPPSPQPPSLTSIAAIAQSREPRPPPKTNLIKKPIIRLVPNQELVKSGINLDHSRLELAQSLLLSSSLSSSSSSP